MNMFEIALDKIQSAKELIKDLTFEQAFELLDGHNKDDDLFDFYIDEITQMQDYLIGTVCNKNGMAVIEDTVLWEYWDGDTEIWAMTEEEIKEQKERLE